MSFEDAATELAGAIEADNSSDTVIEPAVEAAPTTPEGSADVQPHHAASQPRDPGTGKFVVPGQEEPAVAAVEDTPDLFAGEQVNPDELIAQHPELEPYVKQLQGAFTRKTQGLAEKAREFDGLDPQIAREAVGLYQQLQDPDYLVQFHSELTTALEANGLTRAEAQAAAAEETSRLARGETSPSSEPSAALSALREYPELAGVADYLEQLESKSSTALDRVERWEQEQSLREEQTAIRERQMLLAAEVNRQEQMIVQANRENPSFTLETTPEMEATGRISDMDAIYALSGHTDGNLLAAADLYQRIIQSAAVSYFGGKESAGSLPAAGASPAANQTSEIPVELDDLEDAHKAAAEFLRGAGIDHIGV